MMVTLGRNFAECIPMKMPQSIEDRQICSSLAVIAIGSNIDKKENFRRLFQLLEQDSTILVDMIAQTFQNVAIGPDGSPSGQADFYNTAILIITPLKLEALRRHLRAIESRLGRVRSSDKFAPRPIDLDVVAYWSWDEPKSLEFKRAERAHQATDFAPQFIDSEVINARHVALPVAQLLPRWVLPSETEPLENITGRFSCSDIRVLETHSILEPDETTSTREES